MFVGASFFAESSLVDTFTVVESGTGFKTFAPKAVESLTANCEESAPALEVVESTAIANVES